MFKEGKKLQFLNFGTRLEECKKASEILSKKGIDITIIDARFAKPLDEKLIMEAANNHEVLISIEEGSIGGFGSHVMQFLSDRGVFDKGLKFRSMILPDIFIDQDTPEKMYEKAGLDSLSIANKIQETLNSNIVLAKKKQNLVNHTELDASTNDLEHTAYHCFTNRHCSNSNTRIMSSFNRNFVFLPFLSIVSLLVKIDEVGLTAKDATIS